MLQNHTVHVNRQHKSTLFVTVFSDPGNKEAVLQLYNALNHSYYEDTDALRLITIDNCLYMGVNNDVSYAVQDTLFFTEHQSTKNLNMPLRFLQIIERAYSSWLKEKNLNLYSSSLQEIPAPQFVVFYNGRAAAPEIQTLYLSDAFIGGKQGDLEVTVHVFNINQGFNEKLKEACQPLQEYCWFHDRIRSQTDAGVYLADAVDEAIQTMPEEFKLKEFLMKERNEVMHNMFEETSLEEIRVLFEKEAQRERIRADEAEKKAEEERKKNEAERAKREEEKRNAESAAEMAVSLLSSMYSLLMKHGKTSEEAIAELSGISGKDKTQIIEWLR